MAGLKHNSWPGLTSNEKGQKRVCAAAHPMSTVPIKREGMKFTCLVISIEDWFEGHGKKLQRTRGELKTEIVLKIHEHFISAKFLCNIT